jgi:curved DNA-binding protein CbpA
MTRENSLAALNLPASATKADIEQAYHRLVRRYPPEFQPEKFRQIDDAYRFLTSLPAMLEKLLSSAAQEKELDKGLFNLTAAPPSAALEEAILELKQQVKLSFLWPSPAKE